MEEKYELGAALKLLRKMRKINMNENRNDKENDCDKKKNNK